MKNKKMFCHDCKKELKTTNNQEFENGKMLVYEQAGNKIIAFKCNDCFHKNQSLKDYQSCEVYSRVVGYLRPVQQWNEGKQHEFSERKEYQNKK